MLYVITIIEGVAVVLALYAAIGNSIAELVFGYATDVGGDKDMLAPVSFHQSICDKD